MAASSWDNPPFLNFLRQLWPSQRLCMIFEETDDQLAAAAQFHRIGLEKKERGLAALNPALGEQATAALRAAAPAPNGAGLSDAFVIWSDLAEVRGGPEFDNGRFFERLSRWAKENARSPAAPLRLSCDMAWLLGRQQGEKCILEFESAMTQFVSEHRVTALCQWDRRAFAPVTLRRVLMTYDALVYRGGTVRNFHRVPADDLRKGPKGAAELDRLLTNVIDIENAERQIREDREALLTLFDALPEMAALLSVSGTVLQINEEGARRLGGTPEEILGTCIFDYLPTNMEARREGLAALVRSGRGQRYIEQRSGRKIDIRLAPVFDVLGNVARVAALGIDITERLKTDAVLRETIKRLETMESIVNQSPAVVVRARLEEGWPVEYVSESMTQWGYTPEEVRAGNVTWAQNSLAEEKTRVTADVNDALHARRDAFRNEYRILTAAGETRWVEAYERILRNEAGTPSHLQAVVLDVTDRKRAELAAEAHRDRLQAIFRAAPIGIILLSNRVIKDVNQFACDATGYAREDLLGRDSRFLYPSEAEFDRIGREFYHQIRERGIAVVETQVRKKDGSIIDVLLSASLTDPYDPARDITITAMDISDRKRSEQVLRFNEARFRAVFEGAGVGIALISLDGAVLEVNSALLGLFGYEMADLRKFGYPGMTHPPSAIKFWEMVRKAAGGGPMPATLEMTGIRRGGATFKVHFDIARVVDPSGAPTSLLAVVREISDRQAAEPGRAAQETPRPVATRPTAFEALAAGAARRFNRGLEAFYAHADALLNSPNLTPDLRAEFTTCLQFAERAGQFMQRLLVVAGQEPITVATIDLNELLANAQPALRRGLKAGVQIDFQPAARPLIVRVDRAQIERVLAALVANADEATPGGGQTSISAAEAVFDAAPLPAELQAAGAYAVVKIGDAGEGVSDMARARLFEPFFTTKDRALHRGLGLAMARGVLRQNGGGVALVETSNRGATFALYLPLVKNES